MNGPDLLRAYIKTHHDGVQSAFADALGLRRPLICEMLKGKAVPEADTLFLIEDETGGAVPARSWTTRATPKRRAKSYRRRGRTQQNTNQAS